MRHRLASNWVTPATRLSANDKTTSFKTVLIVDNVGSRTTYGKLWKDREVLKTML